MAGKTTKPTLNLLLKALSLCVTESKDKVALTLLSCLKSLVATLGENSEGNERDLRTMRGLVLLIKDRLEGVNALGVTLCNSLAEVFLQLTFKETTPATVEEQSDFKTESKATVISAGAKKVLVPNWAIQAYQLWKELGLNYAEIGRRVGQPRQNVAYWVKRLETLKSNTASTSNEPKPPDEQSQSTELNPSPTSTSDEIWQLLKDKVKKG
jgi:hypothetical protein